MSNTETQTIAAQSKPDTNAQPHAPSSSHEAAPTDKPATLAEVFLQAARVHNKPDALNYKRDGAWHAISSAELIARARHIAYGLCALGLKRGDRVALLSESCPEWVLTDAGCQFAGLVDVPIYSTQAPPQVRYILEDSGTRLLFVRDREAYARVADAIKDYAGLKHIIFFAEAGAQAVGALTLAELEARGRELATRQPTLLEEIARVIKPDDLATIIYTSGTTGEPKGVMLTQANLVSNLIDCAGHLSFEQVDSVLSVLPLSHVFERTGMYMYLHHGMTVYFAESIDSLGQNLREVRPTVVLCVPRLFEKIYARSKERAAAAGKFQAAVLAWAVEVGKEWARRKAAHEAIPPLLDLKHDIADYFVFRRWRESLGGRIRLFVSGGAALPEEIGYIFMGAGVPIVQGYGLTETSPVITAGDPADNRVGTVGRPIPGVEVRIAADGEIEVRGPNVMRGYYHKPDETRAVFTADGWFKTGDIGVLDAEGRLRITDRKKELLKTSGGKYIAPQLVEGRIKQSRFVNQVVLIGNGRKFPAALIVPNFEQLRAYAQYKGINARTAAELCREPRILDLMQRQVDAQCGDLSQYERVKRIALLERELTIEGGELTPTLKIKRRVIDEKYRAVIERLYASAEK